MLLYLCYCFAEEITFSQIVLFMLELHERSLTGRWTRAQFVCVCVCVCYYILLLYSSTACKFVDKLNKIRKTHLGTVFYYSLTSMFCKNLDWPVYA